MIINSITCLKKDFLINKKYKVNRIFYIDLLLYVNKEIDSNILKCIDEAYEVIHKEENKILTHKISYNMLRDKLLESVDESTCKFILKWLKENNYIDDKVFIEKHKEKYKTKKAFVDFLIKNKVYVKDIEFEENLDYAYNLANKYIKANNASNAYIKLKIESALLNKGYESNKINQIIKDLDFNDETIPLQKEVNKLKLKVPKDKLFTKLVNKGYKVENIKKILRNVDYEN